MKKPDGMLSNPSVQNRNRLSPSPSNKISDPMPNSSKGARNDQRGIRCGTCIGIKRTKEQNGIEWI